MKSFLKNASLALTEGIQSFVESSKEVSENLKDYMKSDEYENDLDQIISFLVIIKPLQNRNFDIIRNRQLRVAMKMKFIFSQSRLLIAASAAVGGKVGIVIGGPQGAISGATLGTATGILSITFVAGKVLVRRMSNVDHNVFAR